MTVLGHLPWCETTAAAATTVALMRLRRDGLPPLRFTGHLIARYNQNATAATLQYDLALYRTVDGAYVVEIVALPPVSGPPGRPFTAATRHHAALCATLADALTMLEDYDAAGDICPGLSVPGFAIGDPALSPTAIVMQASALRVVHHDVVRRYRIAVGVFLAELALTAF